MRKINVNKETVGKIARNGCRVALYALAVILPHVSVKETVDAIRYSGNVEYSDVISVIMNSSMFSSDKQEMISLMKKDKDAEYYRSIIQVVKSNMYSGDKVKTIKTIAGE